MLVRQNFAASLGINVGVVAGALGVSPFACARAHLSTVAVVLNSGRLLWNRPSPSQVPSHSQEVGAS